MCVRLGVRTQWPELHARAPVPRAARAPTAVVAVGHSQAEHVACTILWGLLHTWLSKDCSLWSPHAQQTHSERSRWSR